MATTPPAQPQVNRRVRRKRPLWQWLLFGFIALMICGGLANLAAPPKNTPSRSASATTIPVAEQNVIAPTETVEQVAVVLPTETPIPAPDTPTPEPAPTDTAVPVVAPTETPTQAAPTEPQATYSATAWVDNPTPKQRSDVRVFGKLLRDGQPYQGAVMNTLWHYKSKETPCDGAKTKADGVAGCTNSISSATVGYEVVINVTFLVDGKAVARTETSFTPTE